VASISAVASLARVECAQQVRLTDWRAQAASSAEAARAALSPGATTPTAAASSAHDRVELERGRGAAAHHEDSEAAASRLSTAATTRAATASATPPSARTQTVSAFGAVGAQSPAASAAAAASTAVGTHKAGPGLSTCPMTANH